MLGNSKANLFSILSALIFIFSCSPVEIELPVGRTSFTVELALTPDQRSKGLMHREQMPEDHGMLFVFDEEDYRSFWMKNTLIPLSIAYINQEGKILEILEMEPLNERSVPSSFPASYALEVNSGAFDRAGVRVGDWIKLSVLTPYLPNQGRAQN